MMAVCDYDAIKEDEISVKAGDSVQVSTLTLDQTFLARIFQVSYILDKICFFLRISQFLQDQAFLGGKFQNFACIKFIARSFIVIEGFQSFGQNNALSYRMLQENLMRTSFE